MKLFDIGGIEEGSMLKIKEQTSIQSPNQLKLVKRSSIHVHTESGRTTQLKETTVRDQSKYNDSVLKVKQ